MSDLIRREDVLRLAECGKLLSGFYGERAKDIIKAIPSAEPKVGRWIYEECEYLDDETDEGQIFMTGKRWYCSRCRFSKGFMMYRPHEKYCPNCGAKMERRADDSNT